MNIRDAGSHVHYFRPDLKEQITIRKLMDQLNDDEKYQFRFLDHRGGSSGH